MKERVFDLLRFILYVIVSLLAVYGLVQACISLKSRWSQSLPPTMQGQHVSVSGTWQGMRSYVRLFGDSSLPTQADIEQVQVFPLTAQGCPMISFTMSNGEKCTYALTDLRQKRSVGSMYLEFEVVPQGSSLAYR